MRSYSDAPTADEVDDEEIQSLFSETGGGGGAAPDAAPAKQDAGAKNNDDGGGIFDLSQRQLSIFLVVLALTIVLLQAASLVFPGPKSAAADAVTTEEAIAAAVAAALAAVHQQNQTTAAPTVCPEGKVQEAQISTSNKNEPPADYKGIVQLAYRPTTQYKIFMLAPPGSGSTLTLSVLTGLFEGRFAPIGILTCKGGCPDMQTVNGASGYMNQSIVTKSHNRDIDGIAEKFAEEFDNVFFIIKERKEANAAHGGGSETVPVCHDRSAVKWKGPILCLQYEDMLYDDVAGIRRVVKHVADEIRKTIPYFEYAELREEETVHRLIDMARSNAGDKTVKYGFTGGGGGKEHTLGLGSHGEPPP